MSSISTITVAPGLHVLRYVKAKGNKADLIVRVVVSAVSRDKVELICAPGAELGRLDGPGDCLVVRSELGGTVDVVVEDRHGHGGEAELRLDRLAGSGRAVQSGALETELVAHVALRGDVRASKGGWVAGPDAPAPIEGLLLRLRGGEGVELEYQVQGGGYDGQWSAWTAAGGYAGTRGQHRPLQALRVRLAGPAAGGFRVRGEGLFLGSPVQVVEGRQIELQSASGGDPLVGLRIAVVALQSPTETTGNTRIAPEDRTGDRGGGRVRVFRASNSR